MRATQQEKAERAKKASCRPTQYKWHEMNRKQRREVMRKMQSEDISLQVVHPHAAGIDMATKLIMWPYHRDGTTNRCGASGAPPPS